MQLPVARPLRSLFVSFCALAVIGSAAPPAFAARDIPVGVYNLNGARSQDGQHRIWAMRFVLDRDASVDRLFTGFNLEGVYTDPANQPAPVELRTRVLNKGYGAPAAPTNLPAGWTVGTGRIDYGHGNGGRLRARLVPMKADGTPDLSTVLGEETFYPVERYKQTKAEFHIGDRAGMLYARFGGVRLSAGTPYWVVYQNVDPNPRMNYVSFNSPVVKASESGPNGRNTIDPNAPGAIMGLDPREVVAWSLDTGASWLWGREVGIWGDEFIPGDYAGSLTSDDGTRLPWYAWQETGEARPALEPALHVLPRWLVGSVHAAGEELPAGHGAHGGRRLRARRKEHRRGDCPQHPHRPDRAHRLARHGTRARAARPAGRDRRRATPTR